MQLHIFLEALIIFFISVAIHLYIARLFFKKSEIFLIFITFFISPLLYTYFFIDLTLYKYTDMLSIIFLYIGLSCVYIQTFPALKEDIPSFRILRIIANNKKGVSEKEIIKLMGTTDLFNIKLTELEEDNLLKKENSKITLTNSGRILANIFIIYRKLLGLGRGDG